MIMNLQQIKNMENYLDKARAMKKVVDEKADITAGLSPGLSKAERDLINEKIEKIKIHNQYTFEFHEELERLKQQPDLKHLNEHNVRGFGKYSSSDATDANRDAWKLKQEIRKMLEKYKHFDHYVPNPGTTQLKREPVKLPYRKIDSEVLKIEKQLKDLRSYTEEEVYQLEKRGVNMRNYLGITKED